MVPSSWKQSRETYVSFGKPLIRSATAVLCFTLLSPLIFLVGCIAIGAFYWKEDVKPIKYEPGM